MKLASDTIITILINDFDEKIKTLPFFVKTVKSINQIRIPKVYDFQTLLENIESRARQFVGEHATKVSCSMRHSLSSGLKNKILRNLFTFIILMKSRVQQSRTKIQSIWEELSGLHSQC